MKIADRSIKEGDRVNVFWEYVPGIWDAEVIYRPAATGDSWYLKTKEGQVVAVQIFCKMEKIEQRGER